MRSLALGWSIVEIAPLPCGLEWARGSVPHPSGGRIDVSWTVNESSKTMTLSVSYPSDVSVRIRLPEGYAGEIKETRLGR